MKLSDINAAFGPYWADYQATRQRDGILDDPATVPPWFLAGTVCERLAAARVGLEQFKSVSTAHLVELHDALRTVEQFVRATHVIEPAVEQVVAGLLGAQAVQTARENAEWEAEHVIPTGSQARDARHHRERIELTKRHLVESGLVPASGPVSDDSHMAIITRLGEQATAARQRVHETFVALAELAIERGQTARTSAAVAALNIDPADPAETGDPT